MRLMLRQRPPCSHHQSYVRLISAVYITINQPTLLWLCHRYLLTEIPITILLKNTYRFWHQNPQTPRFRVKILIKRLEGRRRSTTNKHRHSRTLDFWLSMLIRLTISAWHATVEIKKTQAKLSITIVTKWDILQRIIPKLEKARTSQKTSIGLGYLRSNN